MHQTTCPHSANQPSRYSTKGHPNTLYGASIPPFKYLSLCNILPFCNQTSSTTLLQYPQHPQITFSTTWWVSFLFVFFKLLPTPHHPTNYPPFPTSRHSPHPPTLYFLAATERYPLGLTFLTVPPVVTLSFQIRSLIQLPFHHSYTRLSTLQPILPITWSSSSTPIPPSSQLFYQCRLRQEPNE